MQRMPTKEEIARGYDAITDKVGLAHSFYERCVGIQKTYSGKVLDIGCGRGFLLARVAKKAELGTEFYGLDISPKLCEISKENNPGATIVCGDAEHLPFPDNMFDTVFMTEALEHMLDYNLALSEAGRVLKPGGTFIVTVPNRDWFRYDFYDKIRDKEMQPVDDHYFRYEEIRTYLTENHFAVRKVIGLDNLWYYGPIHEFERLLAFFLPFLHKRMKRLLFKCENTKS